MISENLNVLRRRIEEAAGRAGRDIKDIMLLCVTKEAATEEIEEAIAAGVADVGENYVQDAAAKFKVLGNQVKWHLIGHLQTNKVKEAVRIFDLIHSVDSIKLAQEISKYCARAGVTKEILIEVKTSFESTKYGVSPERAAGLLEEMRRLPNIKIKGLMTMAPFTDDSEGSRPYFKGLKDLASRIASKNIDNVDMRYLSMGTTQDFEVAIEEGANIIRIGRGIFKG